MLSAYKHQRASLLTANAKGFNRARVRKFEPSDRHSVKSHSTTFLCSPPNVPETCAAHRPSLVKATWLSVSPQGFSQRVDCSAASDAVMGLNHGCGIAADHCRIVFRNCFSA